MVRDHRVKTTRVPIGDDTAAMALTFFPQFPGGTSSFAQTGPLAVRLSARPTRDQGKEVSLVGHFWLNMDGLGVSLVVIISVSSICSEGRGGGEVFLRNTNFFDWLFFQIP